MKITPTLLQSILEEEFDDLIQVKGDKEWQMTSIANPSRKRKLYVNIDKGTAIDFIGGAGYSPIELIKALKNFETLRETEDFVWEYMSSNIKRDGFEEFIRNNNGSFRGDKNKRIKETPVISRIDLPKGTVDINPSNTSLLSKFGLQYMRSRGLTNEEIVKYHLKIYLDDKGCRRIIIPFIENDEIIWYQARAMSNNVVPKYDNPTGVSKSHLVYNIDNLKKVAIITEGPIDAMMVDGQAIMGSTISEWQVAKVLNKKPSVIVVVPDNDDTKLERGRKINPGYQGALKTVESFVDAGYPVNQIKVAFINEGKDLNEIGKSKAIQTISNCVPVNLKTLIQFQSFGATSDKLKTIV